MQILSFRECLGLSKVERNYYYTPPPYSPDTADQTVQYGGAIWKGQPGGGWAFQALPGQTPSSGGSSTPDPVEQAKKLQQFNIEANQPHIQSLQASIPETEQKFASEQQRLLGEKAPLQERYKSLLDQIKHRETQDITAVQRRQSQEFGYRGIPASSTLFLDEQMKAESPIRQAYAGQIKDTGLAQEDSLRGIDELVSKLAGQSVEAKRTIQNAIGQLQSGDPASAIQGAMQILQMQQQQSQFQTTTELQRQQQALQEREFGLQEQIANRPQQQDQFATIGEGSTLFNLLTGQPMYTAPKTYKPSDTFGAGTWE